MKRQSFHEGWLFGKNEESLEKVTLPHDAMQEEGRRKDAPSGTGGAFFLGGEYIYEKHFNVPMEWKGCTQILEFEGVYPSAKVLLNGGELGGCCYGYSNFYVPLTGLVYGNENVLRVLVDNTKTPNSRWYSGAGIYRPIWLWTGGQEHIVLDSVRVTTLDYQTGRIQIDVETTKKHMVDEDLEIKIYEGEKFVAETCGRHTEMSISNARLWSDETPFLYRLEVTLKDGGQVLDTYETNFGIRQISYSNKGLFINGKSVLLKGGCIHHDNGILGARSYARSEWRRIKRLKQFGFNAIRSAHNPLCKAALDACDALGMYVMDEAWDMWDKPKNPYDYALHFQENYESDIRQMACKDYNHPSVIMYSIGNELTEPSKPEGVALAEKLAGTVKKYDSTRPVTAGINLTLLMLASMGIDLTASTSDAGKKDQEEKKDMNSTEYNKMVSEQGNALVQAAASPDADKVSTPVLDLLDICGYNYAVSRYEMEGELHPERIIVGSETYAYDLAKTWELVEEKPYVIGDFMWTAWDYLGETGIGSWSYTQDGSGFDKNYPWLLADTGALDILGNDNAEAGMASAVWRAGTEPYIAMTPANHPGITPVRAIWRGSNALPHWSYDGCDGNEVEVQVYADAAEVELFVNGGLIGRKKTQDCTAVFQTTYQSGSVRAVSYDADGNIIAENTLHSAAGPFHVQIRQESLPSVESVTDEEIVYLDIDIVGSNGIVECNADETLTVSVEGGELLAFGSANPRTEESFLTGMYKTYYGRSQAVIRPAADMVRVIVSSERFSEEEFVITVNGEANGK